MTKVPDLSASESDIDDDEIGDEWLFSYEERILQQAPRSFRLREDAGKTIKQLAEETAGQDNVQGA